MLPLTDTLTPASVDDLVDAIRSAADARTTVYPIGGGTSLEYGLPARSPGVGLSLAGLNRVLDYPARDMTITVEAGVPMSQLAAMLAAEGQRIPIDTPHADRATLGGVIATNWSGPRRYGQGTIRDYVLGISAVDGLGHSFKGGGRVVKNVAGYDFCKLLTGSLGTLGVITQTTLKVKPIPTATAFVMGEIADFDQAEKLLAGLVHSATVPTAIELLVDPQGQFADRTTALARLAVGLEGTCSEVAWMIDMLRGEFIAAGVPAENIATIDDWAGSSASSAATWWDRFTNFTAMPGSPLVIKANVPPSAVTRFIVAAREIDPQAALLAHAGNGVVCVRFSVMPRAGLARTLLGRLYPVAASAGGHCVLLSTEQTAELTSAVVWSGSDSPFELMRAVKRQFDPHDILNRGRFVY